MSKTDQAYSWAELAFAKSLPLPKRTTFVTAPRVMTTARLKQLIKRYLPSGSIVWGVAEEEYVLGFEGQPQFETLKSSELEKLAEKVNAQSASKIYILRYRQRDLPHVVRKLKPSVAVFVRGSWQYALHTQPVYYELVNRGSKIEYVSPYIDDVEAQDFANRTKTLSVDLSAGATTKEDFMHAAHDAARASYDHSFQVGAVLAKKTKAGYRYVSHSHNQVVPYETYAQHFGFSREDNFAPPNDLNFYDTVHAETAALIKHADTRGLSLFINVMPCPTCARALVLAGINEVFYGLDHSDGYAVKLLADADIHTERIVL